MQSFTRKNYAMASGTADTEKRKKKERKVKKNFRMPRPTEVIELGQS
jgi:hypothetical protein